MRRELCSDIELRCCWQLRNVFVQLLSRLIQDLRCCGDGQVSDWFSWNQFCRLRFHGGQFCGDWWGR